MVSLRHTGFSLNHPRNHSQELGVRKVAVCRAMDFDLLGDKAGAGGGGMQGGWDCLMGLPWVMGNRLMSAVTARVSQGLYSATHLSCSSQDLENHCFWSLGPKLSLTITIPTRSSPLSSYAYPSWPIQHLYHEVIHKTFQKSLGLLASRPIVLPADNREDEVSHESRVCHSEASLNCLKALCPSSP